MLLCATGTGEAALTVTEIWLKLIRWLRPFRLDSSPRIEASASRIWAFRLSICAWVVAFASCLSSDVRSARSSASWRWSETYWPLTSWVASVRELTEAYWSSESEVIVACSAELGTLSRNWA